MIIVFLFKLFTSKKKDTKIFQQFSFIFGVYRLGHLTRKSKVVLFQYFMMYMFQEKASCLCKYSKYLAYKAKNMTNVVVQG